VSAGPGGKAGFSIVHLLLLVTMLLWGATFSAGKLASQGAGPLTIAFFRFVLAAALLLPQLRLSEGSFLPKRNTPRSWLFLFLSGLTGLVLYNYFFIKGLSLTDAGRGSVIVAANPAFIYLGSVVFFKERLTLVRAVGIALAVLGTVLVVSSGNPLALFKGGVSLGDFFMFLCVLTWASYSLLGKQVVGEVTPLAGNAWTTVIAAVLLVPPLLLSDEPLLAFLHFSFSTWAAIVFLGVGGTVLGFTFFYRGILALGPNKAGVFISLVPFFGIICGAVVFGEPITVSIVGGLVVSLLGLTLIQKY
jgi:drug/metabolite transporter (DMT)-like permease